MRTPTTTAGMVSALAESILVARAKALPRVEAPANDASTSAVEPGIGRYIGERYEVDCALCGGLLVWLAGKPSFIADGERFVCDICEDDKPGAAARARRGEARKPPSPVVRRLPRRLIARPA